MKCYRCDRTAIARCSGCGRPYCKTHGESPTLIITRHPRCYQCWYAGARLVTTLIILILTFVICQAILQGVSAIFLGDSVTMSNILSWACFIALLTGLTGIVALVGLVIPWLIARD